MQTQSRRIREAFYWNSRSWSRPFLRAIEDIDTNSQSLVLELGAGPYSALSLLFLDSADSITISTYPESMVPAVAEYMDKYAGGYSNYSVSCQSIFSIQGCYDLILMKSVLGGLFRTNTHDYCGVNELLSEISKNHLLPGGRLITLDNGSTFLDRIIGQHGARRNHWRYFHSQDFQGYAEQYRFGILSRLSFRIRLPGWIALPLENCVYWIDSILSVLFRTGNPSVIVTVYSSDD